MIECGGKYKKTPVRCFLVSRSIASVFLKFKFIYNQFALHVYVVIFIRCKCIFRRIGKSRGTSFRLIRPPGISNHSKPFQLCSYCTCIYMCREMPAKYFAKSRKLNRVPTTKTSVLGFLFISFVTVSFHWFQLGLQKSILHINSQHKRLSD